jgi:hypothetical protein
MYRPLTQIKYKKMSAEAQREDFKKWVADALDNKRAIIRSIAGTMIEQDFEIDNALATPFDELALLINEYTEGTTPHFIVKYRLENNLKECDDSLLDTDDYGKHSCKIIVGLDDDEDNEDDTSINVRKERDAFDDLIQFCKIFCFEDLLKSLEAWRP